MIDSVLDTDSQKIISYMREKWHLDHIRTEAELMEAAYAQRRAAIWYAEAQGALWMHEANGFSGYLSQYHRWMKNAADEYATARRLMGIE